MRGRRIEAARVRRSKPKSTSQPDLCAASSSTITLLFAWRFLPAAVTSVFKSAYGKQGYSAVHPNLRSKTQRRSICCTSDY
ncbi:uncharacterized protein BO80DRAFT_198118 [Aspergillus ibericus CBS 121593]|uniref:Uncharacterized protein n=1 Tax=Aspergillus ibericus CBS 121593 TaxID=1448316 RepID=A0A395GSP9_9EURO|nr:hypothetical protein BO80DRAFT_198118 [Aspergillus ibericus CBS 121593]RAK97113.1 hypothetical protein BO80DRAFT_198118 [Aspergillus ibericus CBS 121593]